MVKFKDLFFLPLDIDEESLDLINLDIFIR